MSIIHLRYLFIGFICCLNTINGRPQDVENKDDTSLTVSNKARCGNHNVCGTKGFSQNCSKSVNEISETKFGEWPHMCAILKKRTIGGETKLEFWAGASLITPGVLLTAAHWVK